MSYPTTWPRLFILGFLAGSLGACSDDPPPAPPPAKAALGEACAVTKDCQEGLICRSMVCATRPDAGDMGTDMATDPDAAMTDMQPKVDMAPPVDNETYFISYVMKDDAAGGARLPFVVDTRTGATTQITDRAELCAQGCWITEDLSTFVYKQNGIGGKENIWTQPIGTDFKLSGSPLELLTNISDFYFRDSTLTYARENVDKKDVFYLPATAKDSSGEVKIHEIATTGSNSGLWYLDTKANKAVVFFPSNTTLDVRVAELGKEVTAQDSVYVFDAANFDAVSYSYRGQPLPTAFSPDGRHMAVAMNAPNHYELCQGAGTCDVSKGRKCGLGHPKANGSPVCTAQEITVYLFDLQNLQELRNGSNPGKKCARDSDCSSAHQCYIPDLKAADLSVCAPRQVVMGLPTTPKQPVDDADAKSGCELLPVEGVEGVMRYTDYGRSLEFGQDGALYTTATRECAKLPGEANIDVTDVLRIPVTQLGTPSVITGNVKSDYSSLNCYNSQTKMVEAATCPIYIEEALLSPEGTELVMRATNPQADDPDKANTLLDVWTVKRDGSRRTWLGKNTKGDEVVQLSVHKRK